MNDVFTIVNVVCKVFIIWKSCNERKAMNGTTRNNVSCILEMSLERKNKLLVVIRLQSL